MFRLIKIEGGRINVPEPQILPVGNTAVVTGQALVLSGGKLVSATGKPTFVALNDGAANGECAVGRVESNQIYEVECTAVPTLGTKVTISDGKKVTATTADGVAEIVDVNGATAAGDTVLVRFA